MPTKDLHACQKGLLTKTDIDKKLQIARKMKRDHSTNFWTNLFTQMVRVHKYNLADQARAPSERI